MPYDPRTPFNELPKLPPQVEIETRPVLKACIEARAALAELKAASALIPNPTVLINTIPLLEAQASSEIENIVTTTDRLFLHASDVRDAADPATKEALRYRTALHHGFRELRSSPLSIRSCVEICSIIKGVDMQVRATPGTALANQATGEIIYTPPAGEARLRDLLADWERFLHSDLDVDPIVRMAIAHYQFEAIHPFTDGNGRTGRIINILSLVEQGLLDLPVLYLSRAIIERKSDYYRLIAGVTERGEWGAWVRFMVEAVRETAQWTSARIRAIRDLLDAIAERIRRDAPGVYSRELAELIFVQPYCRIGNVVAAGIAQRQAASGYLKKLCEISILAEIKAGREKLFINRAFLDLLKQR